MADVRSRGDCPKANGDVENGDDDEVRSAGTGKELLLTLEPSGFRLPRRSSRTEFRHAAIVACALLSRAPGLGRLRETTEFAPGGNGCACSIARRWDSGRSSASSSGIVCAGQVMFRFRGLFRNRSHGSIDTEVEEGL